MVDTFRKGSLFCSVKKRIWGIGLKPPSIFHGFDKIQLFVCLFVCLFVAHPTGREDGDGLQSQIKDELEGRLARKVLTYPYNKDRDSFAGELLPGS
jgi:hypothetical protein